MERQCSEPIPLHLAPRSREHQRQWEVGNASPRAPGPDGAELALDVLPDRHESFASLRAILAQLQGYATPEHLERFAKLEGYLRQACPDSDADGGHGRLLADSVTFAIMRRISRESVYTARVIDTSAHLINDVLHQVSGDRAVHVMDIDRLDRPSLKVLARSVLLLEPTHRFSWVWHSASDPTDTRHQDSADLYLASRSQLLRQLVGMIEPTIRRHADTASLTRPTTGRGPASTYDIGAALVVQNYDACFLWCDALLQSGIDAEVVEGLRLLALAAVNIGNADEALRLLQRAEAQASGPGRRAHLAYLQGLIDAKRSYDLTRSTAHYRRGLAALGGGVEDGEDLPLERGWLYNGLALNEALEWRRDPQASAGWAEAFSLEQSAFDLVREGRDPARVYLRFNLLANSAFLAEMQQHYDLAIRTFRQAFDFGLDTAAAAGHRWTSTLNYRIGVLSYRAGRRDEADRLLREAADHDAAIEIWPTRERILRGLGTVAIDRRAYAEAAAFHDEGLQICRNARSAEGTREHASGLLTALLLANKPGAAQEVSETLAAEEGLTRLSVAEQGPAAGPGRTRPALAPKLPAYIPEIDLEGVPPIDINRFLSRTLPASAAAPPWRSERA